LPGIPETLPSETAGALLLAGALDAGLLAGALGAELLGAAAWLDVLGLDAAVVELPLEHAARVRPIAATPAALAMRYLI
jgi:hypothetical protein